LVEYFTRLDSPAQRPLLSGDEIMQRYHLGSGPLIGKILSLLREAQQTRQIATREQAEIWLDQRVAELLKE